MDTGASLVIRAIPGPTLTVITAAEWCLVFSCLLLEMARGAPSSHRPRSTWQPLIPETSGDKATLQHSSPVLLSDLSETCQLLRRPAAAVTSRPTHQSISGADVYARYRFGFHAQDQGNANRRNKACTRQVSRTGVAPPPLAHPCRRDGSPPCERTADVFALPLLGHSSNINILPPLPPPRPSPFQVPCARQ